MKKLCLLFVLVSLLSCFSSSTAIANTTLPNRCTIGSALNSNLVLDITNNSSENCANVQIYANNGSAAQIFDLVHVENDWYKIVHVSSGKLIDVTGAQKASGVNVQIYEPTGSDAQLWKFIPTTGGYYIQNKLGYYLDVQNGTAQSGTNVWVYQGNGTKAQIWNLNTILTSNSQTQPTYQPAMWFMDVVKFTQKPGGNYSHAGTLNFDVVGVNNSDIKAPFDCKVVAIYKTWAEGNTVVIESIVPVQYADGTVDYMCMSFAHDNYVGDLWVGKTISQGEIFYQTGNYGNVTGVHAHVCCIRGTFQKDIWKRQPPNNNCGSPNSICPTKALFLPQGIPVYDTKGLVFQTYDPHICTNFNSVGVCAECGKDFVLQNRTTLNSKFTTIQVDGAIHTAPYGDAPINGRLQKDAIYTITESVVNVFGNLWYKLEGTDNNGLEQWVVSDYVALHTCKTFDKSGYCKECKSEFVLQDVKYLNQWMEATKENGAMHTRPYGLGEINGRLTTNNDQLYLVTQSAINSEGNLWYLVNDTDGIQKWVVNTYLKEVFDHSVNIEIPNVPTEDTNTPTSTITLQATGAGNITTTNATVYGTASYSGSRPSEVGLLFGENASSLQIVANEAINFSKNPFDIWYDLNNEAKITLAPGKTYYYQLYAIVDGQYSYSNIVEFTTLTNVSVWTTGASNITATNATVSGSVKYTGNRPTTVGLLFGTSPTQLNNVASDPINFSKNPFDVWYDLNSEAHWTLSAGQTYYYQFYVLQDGYYTYSNIASFQN